jgi:hypothetical protein
MARECCLKTLLVTETIQPKIDEGTVMQQWWCDSRGNTKCRTVPTWKFLGSDLQLGYEREATNCLVQGPEERVN